MPGMLFLKSLGQSRVLLETSRPTGVAHLPSASASRKSACQNWSRKRFRCWKATLLMIASVLESNPSEHGFRCSEALLPMAGCHHTQHCFQKAMAWTNRGVSFPNLAVIPPAPRLTPRMLVGISDARIQAACPGHGRQLHFLGKKQTIRSNFSGLHYFALFVFVCGHCSISATRSCSYAVLADHV